MDGGQLVCVHLHLVNGLLKDADTAQGLSERTPVSTLGPRLSLRNESNILMGSSKPQEEGPTASHETSAPIQSENVVLSRLL